MESTEIMKKTQETTYLKDKNYIETVKTLRKQLNNIEIEGYKTLCKYKNDEENHLEVYLEVEYCFVDTVFKNIKENMEFFIDFTIKRIGENYGKHKIQHFSENEELEYSFDEIDIHFGEIKIEITSNNIIEILYGEKYSNINEFVEKLIKDFKKCFEE